MIVVESDISVMMV